MEDRVDGAEVGGKLQLHHALGDYLGDLERTEAVFG